MREIILSDITVMGKGYCVIGLEQMSPDVFRSVRPMPPRGFAWGEPFPHQRGACVQFQPLRTAVTLPHIEDQQSQGLIGTGRTLTEDELVGCLRRAEVALNLEHLFGCPVQTNPRGGGAAWVSPREARRSICGCEYQHLRFWIFPEPDGFTLRAGVVLESNERLDSVPIVDREWRAFVAQLIRRIERSNPIPLATRFLNRPVQDKLFADPHRFSRIGLPRPRGDDRCWLMLDSLFPQPREFWLDEL